MFIVKCSWCNREISRAPGPNGISHGICPPCYEKTMREIKTFLPRNVTLVKEPLVSQSQNDHLITSGR